MREGTSLVKLNPGTVSEGQLIYLSVLNLLVLYIFFAPSTFFSLSLSTFFSLYLYFSSLSFTSSLTYRFVLLNLPDLFPPNLSLAPSFSLSLFFSSLFPLLVTRYHNMGRIAYSTRHRVPLISLSLLQKTLQSRERERGRM